MEENTQNQEPTLGGTPEVQTDGVKPSIFSKLFPKLSFGSFRTQSFLIPVAIVILVLLIGGGGTYIVASNVFTSSNNATPGDISSISQSDIPESVSIKQPSPTPAPTKSIDKTSTSNTSSVTPTPTPNPALTWTPYAFSPVFLEFKYPPGWYVSTPATSGAPFMYVQNYNPATGVPTSIVGAYNIYIARLGQVGITTVSQLTTQLAVNDVNNVYVNGVNMGTTSVLTSNSKTINGYLAYERTVSYSNSPGSSIYQLYVLDGVTNVIQFVPGLDTVYGQPYFNTLISTISFTN